MKRIVILETVILAVLLFLFFSPKQDTASKTKTIKINNHQLYIEIADTDALRTQGLSGRTNLAQDHGMLFIFPTIGYYQFWMKDMKFPLDFIWIAKEKVIDFTENVTSPNTDNENLPRYTSKFPFDKVLELNSGIIKKLDIRIGDKVLIK